MPSHTDKERLRKAQARRAAGKRPFKEVTDRRGGRVTQLKGAVPVAKLTTAQKAVGASAARAQGGTSTDRLKGRGGSRAATSTRPGAITTSAQARTQAKANQAKIARLEGGTSTSRIKGKINITKTAKAFDLARITSMARKSRSPFLMSFALGLDELLKHKKAKKINIGPI